MPDLTNFMRLMNHQAVSAVDAAGPVAVLYGTVVSASPLKVMTEQQLPLEADQLVLARCVTDYVLEMDVEWETEKTSGGSGEASFSSHSHKISGRRAVTVRSGLKVGEKVILLRMQGGQKFIVADRVVSA